MLVKGVCTAAEAAALADEIDRTPLDASCGDLELDGVVSLSNPWNRSLPFVGFLDRDPVAVVAENALGSGSGPGGGGSPPHDNHVVSMIATRAAPGAAGASDGVHLDFLPMEVDAELLASGEIAMPLFITTALYCLTAGTAEVGICAGSHLAGRAPSGGEAAFNGAAPAKVAVEAGDVLMYRCDAWKCVFANDSPNPRHALRVHYSQPHIGHRFHPLVAEGGDSGFRFNPEIVSELNPRQRRMLGEHAHYGYD